jgi:hypothetical protein
VDLSFKSHQVRPIAHFPLKHKKFGQDFGFDSHRRMFRVRRWALGRSTNPKRPRRVPAPQQFPHETRPGTDGHESGTAASSAGFYTGCAGSATLF